MADPEHAPESEAPEPVADEGTPSAATTDEDTAPEPSTDEPSPGDEEDSSSPTVEDLIAALGGPARAEAPPDPELDPDLLTDEPATPPAAEGPAPGGVELVESLPIDEDDDLSALDGDEGEASPRLVSIVESLLFAANKPLTVKEVRKVLGGETTVRQIQLALRHLGQDTAQRGVVMRQVAGGFVLRTHPENSAWVQRLLQAKPTRLSRPQLETLAVVAYRQPITRAEIDHVRGVDGGAVVKILLEKELLHIVGRKEEVGRPLLYGTTVKFLEFFNLRSLRDLPDLREFRELSEETKQTLRKNMGDDEVEALGQEVLDFATTAEASPEAAGEGEASAEGEAASGDGAVAQRDSAAETGPETEDAESSEDAETPEDAESSEDAETPEDAESPEPSEDAERPADAEPAGEPEQGVDEAPEPEAT